MESEIMPKIELLEALHQLHQDLIVAGGGGRPPQRTHSKLDVVRAHREGGVSDDLPPTLMRSASVDNLQSREECESYVGPSSVVMQGRGVCVCGGVITRSKSADGKKSDESDCPQLDGLEKDRDRDRDRERDRDRNRDIDRDRDRDKERDRDKNRDKDRGRDYDRMRAGGGGGAIRHRRASEGSLAHFSHATLRGRYNIFL